MTEAAASTSSSLPRLSEKQLERYFLPINAIPVAIAIIALLGLSGVFPSNESAYIMGGITFGGSAVALTLQAKIMRHNPDEFPTSGKVSLCLVKISLLALCILGMSGTLSPQIMGLGILATYAFSYSINIMRQEANQDLKKSLHYLIPIALTIINLLGATGVIGGADASLILGMTTMAGGILFALVDYYHFKDELPRLGKVLLSLVPITAIAFGVLGIVGVPPVTIGIAGVGTITSVYVTMQFLLSLIVNCKNEETRLI